MNANKGLKASTTSSITTEKKGGDASIPSTTFNIAKSIIGSGVLSLPSGIAFFADEPSALIPACFLCVAMGLIGAYTYSSIGKACEHHNAKSFQDVWEKSVDPTSAKIINYGITAQCFLASLAYSIIIADSFSSLAAGFKAPAQIADRTNMLLMLTITVLYPLCSLKSLSSLAPFSMLGLSGIVLTAIFMATRFIDKSYIVGGKFFNDIVLKPSFSKRGGYKIDQMIFVLVSMLSSAYVAHFNAPNFYAELKNNTSKRFNIAVYGAFGASIVTYLFMMSIGFLTFGGNSLGFILNNYAKTDAFAGIARCAVGLAIITSYPFTFSAFRNNMLDLLKLSEEKRKSIRTPLTVGLLGMITGLALVVRDVGFVTSFSGAMFCSAIMFCIPAVMTISNANKPGVTKKPSAIEILINKGIFASGIVMATVGIVISVLQQMGKI